ncbi:hypothetical protein EVAR_15885_1 [Eumeta japonica]|uniref:Uncharacterized protein n=1 Tax=Eumeta variegata TaxID=151549 RepID=A0A4C1UEC3_EUMVA|nr:hypothetical protein EVAR_15885_1 [Eumeta japonica]
MPSASPSVRPFVDPYVTGLLQVLLLCRRCVLPRLGRRSSASGGGRLHASNEFCPSPPSSTATSQPSTPPDAVRMRGDARARGWSGVGTGLTSQSRRRQNEEVEGRGSLTRTALAAAVRRVDSLISGRQARSVRSTPTRVTDACRLDPFGVHQRPTTGARLRVQLELCLLPPPSSSTNLRRSPSNARLRLRNDRARPRVGRRLGSGTMSINGSTRYGPLPLEPSGSCPRREDARA